MSDIFYNGIGKKDQYTEFILGRGENNETCVLCKLFWGKHLCISYQHPMQ